MTVPSAIPLPVRTGMTVLTLSLAAGISSGLAQTPDPRLNQGPKPEAVGRHAMVSTQLPGSTEAALEVLRNGGNAVDAMITAVILQHVLDTHQNSHFGTMSGIYFEAETGEYHVISAVAERPLASRCGQGDPSQVAIGGTIRGLEALWKRWGTLAWEDYFAPAIRAAEEGVEVTSFMYGINYQMFESGQIAANPAARAAFMPDGHLVPVGERWKIPTLAAHLRRLADEGADYMYRGAWAEQFVAEARRRGYCVSMEDMAAYEVQWQEPVRFTYRGHEIIGSAPPDQGGAVVGYNLNVLEQFDLASMGHYAESPQTLEVMARAFGRVAQETRWAIQDPRSFRVPLQLWLSPEYGRQGAEFVRNTMAQPGVALGAGPMLAAENHLARSFVTNGEPEEPASNHNVIVDANGNWFSVLHTGHGGAPGIWMDGQRTTGSSGRAFTDGPGRRVVLPITAIMVAEPGSRTPWMALGTPGNPPQPVTQVLVNLLDFGMHPRDAADAPRFWAFRGDDGPSVEIESRISAPARHGMRAAGIRVRELGDYNWRTGSMQIVWRDLESRGLHGVSDPRRLGHAAGY
jgi:gamma-glutamyltranspeptidase / glutathione hydrolase